MCPFRRQSLHQAHEGQGAYFRPTTGPKPPEIRIRTPEKHTRQFSAPYTGTPHGGIRIPPARYGSTRHSASSAPVHALSEGVP